MIYDTCSTDVLCPEHTLTDEVNSCWLAGVISIMTVGSRYSHFTLYDVPKTVNPFSAPSLFRYCHFAKCRRSSKAGVVDSLQS